MWEESHLFKCARPPSSKYMHWEQKVTGYTWQVNTKFNYNYLSILKWFDFPFICISIHQGCAILFCGESKKKVRLWNDPMKSKRDFRSSAARCIEGAKRPRNQRGVRGASPGKFSKKAGKWCKSRPPWLFFQQIIVYEINTILYSYFQTQQHTSHSNPFLFLE